jgi:hypothetical protein
MLRRVALVSTDVSEESIAFVLTRATWRYILEDGILYGHRSENFKLYIALTGWAL